MYITYHTQVPAKQTLNLFPHSCLSREVQNFIITKGLKQFSYCIEYKGVYLFIYLKNGDRIDVAV